MRHNMCATTEVTGYSVNIVPTADRVPAYNLKTNLASSAMKFIPFSDESGRGRAEKEVVKNMSLVALCTW